MNLPNKLTILRVILIPVFVVFMLVPQIPYNNYIAVAFFSIACITDSLDGHLARKNNQVTDLGKILDQIADKLLVSPILIVFASEGVINPIIPVIIVARDIIVDAIRMDAASKGKVVAAKGYGKVKTASLMIGIILLYINDVPFIYKNIRIDLLLVYFGTIMSVVSLIQYYQLNKKINKQVLEN